jgi:vacuolar-type H+-ATPase subunit I/STV1
MTAPTSPVEVISPRTRPSVSLYEIEDALAAYAETAELVQPEQEDEFFQEFAALMNQAIEKRDRVGQFIAHLEQQIQFADAEITRLKERKRAYALILARVEAYLVRVLESLGLDSKGKTKKLEGKTVTFSLRRNPPSVLIKEEGLIPMAYKTASVALKLAEEQWNRLLDSLNLELRALILDVARVEVTPSKHAIKAALESSTEVLGAEIAPVSFSLVRK